MQANWSLILNVVLLAGVVYAIIHVLQTRKRAAEIRMRSPSIGQFDAKMQHDDIIAIRRVSELTPDDQPIVTPERESVDESSDRLFTAGRDGFAQTHTAREENEPKISTKPDVEQIKSERMSFDQTCIVETSQVKTEPLMMFLLAKANRHLAGYELLQAVLAAGLRFGEGNLFHRHQYSNGQGTVMCSLAAATDQGVFDLQNIGAFTVPGLCIYMHASGNPGIDEERFDIMLDTAKTLSEDLDTYLLDDRRQLLSEVSIERYHRKLNLSSLETVA